MTCCTLLVQQLQGDDQISNFRRRHINYLEAKFIFVRYVALVVILIVKGYLHKPPVIYGVGYNDTLQL